MLQFVFLLAFLAMAVIAFRLWRLYREQPVQGVGWWVCGCCGVCLTPFMVLAAPCVGEWSLSMAAHITSIGGFCSIWIGMRLFFGIGTNRFVVPLFIAFLCCLSFVFYWFWLIDPRYQVRLTVNCVFLLLFSTVISQALFTARIRTGAVTLAGVLFMIFALINGFRTINIILFPDGRSVYLSDGFSRFLTVAMLPVLLVALGTLEFLVRSHTDLHAENDE